MIYNMETTRAQVREAFKAILVKYDMPDADKCATHIEYSCYKTTVDRTRADGYDMTWNENVRNIYHYQTSNIYNNLNPASSVASHYLLDAIRDGSIVCKRICELETDKLAPQNTAQLREKINSRANIRLVEKTSDTYKCEKCGMRKTQYTLKQTRSADEPQTAYIRCMNCGYHWNTSKD